MTKLTRKLKSGKRIKASCIYFAADHVGPVAPALARKSKSDKRIRATHPNSAAGCTGTKLARKSKSDKRIMATHPNSAAGRTGTTIEREKTQMGNSVQMFENL